MKRFILLIGIIICLLIIGGFIYVVNRISVPASASSEEVAITIETGKGVREIADQLVQEGLITDPFVFKLYLLVLRDHSKLQAGEYQLARNLSMIELVGRLILGEVSPKERLITIVEGWNSREIADYLEKQGIIFADEFILAAQTSDTRNILPQKTYGFLEDKPVNQGLEGYLFPDTYRVYKDAGPVKIVEKMLDNFDLKLNAELREKIANQGKTIFETVTLASIVEKEVGTEADRKIVAGIFLDRLGMGKPLESDATINYVTGKNVLQPTYQDTEVSSPYNTYKNTGLPSGPICNPSLESIHAVINPTESDYLYFLTKPDGTTVFSKTYEEHLGNKKKYLK